MKITLPDRLVDLVVQHCKRTPMSDDDVIDFLGSALEDAGHAVAAHKSLRRQLADEQGRADALERQLQTLRKSLSNLADGIFN